MKFHIRLDSDSIFNLFFSWYYCHKKKKSFRKENIWEPNSTDKGRALHWISKHLWFSSLYVFLQKITYALKSLGAIFTPWKAQSLSLPGCVVRVESKPKQTSVAPAAYTEWKWRERAWGWACWSWSFPSNSSLGCAR